MRQSFKNKNTSRSFPLNNSCQPVVGSHDVVSSLQFALVGVNSRSSSCCFARRSDSRSTRCCQVGGGPMLALVGDEDGRDELDEEDNGCAMSSSEASTNQ